MGGHACCCWSVVPPIAEIIYGDNSHLGGHVEHVFDIDSKKGNVLTGQGEGRNGESWHGRPSASEEFLMGRNFWCSRLNF